jgi:Na+-translocating ferredoxin:NAD+ oxidoreductase subunit B
VATERSRRELFRTGLRVSATAAIGGVAGALALRDGAKGLVWQIDPAACVQCERCSTHCVLAASAVKCVHAYDLCGYCKLCGGYHRPDAKVQDTAAENQLCPTGAIRRTFIEEPFYEYTIDEELCIGCGRCAKGCGAFGNSSLYLQVRHDRCLGCNQCAIAEACPSQAFRRVPASRPYLLKGRQRLG